MDINRPDLERSAPRGSDAQLVERLAIGEEFAFRALYDLYVRDVYRYAMSIIADQHEVDDVTQLVWVTLWNRRKNVHIHGNSLLPWLLVTTRNFSLKSVASSRREISQHPSDISTSANGDPEQVAEQRALIEYVNATLRGLSDPDRAVFQLCINEGLSYEAAASRLGVNVKSVRNRLHRVRGKLRASLTTQGEQR